MFKCVEDLIHYSRVLFKDLADPRSQDLLLMRDPYLTIGIIAAYLWFVLKIGQSIMKNREPFQINKIVILFNVTQIICCLYLVVKATRLTYFGGGYNFFCEPVNYGNDERSLEIVHMAHSYFLLKIYDLLDTVFFVLRKKNAQITFLHVYHHSGMVAIAWIATKYFPGGHSVFTGYANCIVHVIMYSYYLAVLLFPQYKKNFWWKKYITQVQIIQFFLMFLHWVSLYLHPGCGYPKFIVAFLLPQNFFMFALFIDFYYRAYIKPLPQEKPNLKKPVNERIGFAELFQ